MVRYTRSLGTMCNFVLIKCYSKVVCPQALFMSNKLEMKEAKSIMTLALIKKV